MPRFVACLLAAVVAAAALAQPARAAVIVADFREDLIFFGPIRTLERLDVNVQVVPSPQLTAADQTSNPSNLNGALNVGLDPTTNVLSLTGDSNGGFIYSQIVVTISGLTFDTAGQGVTGFAPITTGNALGDMGAGPAVVTTAFTADSVTVTYTSPLFNSIVPGTDTFQLTLGGAAAVPEPASLALVVVGLPAVAAARRFRRRAAG